MILLIDTSDTAIMYVGLARRDGFLIAHKKIRTHFQQSEKLLSTIDGLLRSQKMSLRRITGIAVISGPGGFTSLRVGITTANALAYGLGLPIVGLDHRQIADIRDFAKQAGVAFVAKKPGSFIAPMYGSEPNITISTKKLF